ncbi:NUDIX hydrolase [Rhodoblastus acidophilus]|uniref:NUDIX hydrolase n=1 Tax=Candidatus Rhodoblastus alkanivorans TaxID=2954117 RepID=A0ABS9Z8Q3_9HYPH|nr:NUDIX hydrolase [Candidatus Rhodoblastus alkanivorans]MCI4680344.1 NUDIX hydrolase [Candidatus Rhodoblastus alkanivorans]MCI4684003.1 NUDIX hydrolase [Candidatus Rhodoblastus alkanivorans]MDI4641322.1 NUDIX hydrolase [Rhodoblastus acidophilus]
MPGISDGHYRVARLETFFRPAPWAFAESEVARINAHWMRARAEKPAMFDGRVLLMRDPEIVATPEGDVLRGAFFDTDYRNFLAWSDFGAAGEPEGGVYNCFSMAALRTRDGDFLLVEMGAHTANAGKIYFAAGTPDLSDIFGEKVDLAASVAREMEEETGFSPVEAPPAAGWSVIVAGRKIACIQQRLLPLAADEALARAEDFLAREEEPELARLHAAYGLKDIDPARMPDFIQTFLRDAFAAQPCG